MMDMAIDRVKKLAPTTKVNARRKNNFQLSGRRKKQQQRAARHNFAGTYGGGGGGGSLFPFPASKAFFRKTLRCVWKESEEPIHVVLTCNCCVMPLVRHCYSDLSRGVDVHARHYYCLSCGLAVTLGGPSCRSFHRSTVGVVLSSALKRVLLCVRMR